MKRDIKMMRIIKAIVVFCFINLFLSLPSNVYAQDAARDYLQGVQEQMQGALDSDAEKYINDNNIDLNGNVSEELSFKKILSAIIKTFTFGLGDGIKLFATMLAIILICALCEGLSVEKSGTAQVLNLIGVMSAIGILYTRLISTMEYIQETVTDTGRFMLTFVPVFASVVGASGSITGATSYYVTLIFIAEIASQVAINVLLPFLSIFLALSIVESINPSLSLSGLTSGVRKAVQWVIGLIMTVFVGAISIQGIVGVSADTVGTKTAKFLMSSFIPVVGGAVSEAYTTVKGSLGLIRSSVGSFGIIAVLAMIIPPLANVLTVKLAVGAASVAGDALGVKKISLLLKNTSSVLTLALSIMICMALMLIISTTIMMLVCMSL